eukprot:3278954-Rhodomonas_salina.1
MHGADDERVEREGGEDGREKPGSMVSRSGEVEGREGGDVEEQEREGKGQDARGLSTHHDAGKVVVDEEGEEEEEDGGFRDLSTMVDVEQHSARGEEEGGKAEEEEDEGGGGQERDGFDEEGAQKEEEVKEAKGEGGD